MEQLIEAVRDYLDMTWETDAAENRKLGGIVARGTAYLNGVVGSELDFTVEGKPRELLFEYVRYVRENALNEYLKSYVHELLDLRLTVEMST